MYYLSIDAKNIPLDNTLRNALPLRHRELCSRFDINGLADIRARVFSTDDANEVAPPGVGDLPARSERIPVAGLGPAAPLGGGASPARPAAAGPGIASAGLPTSRRVSFLANVSCKQGSLKLLPGTPEPSRPPGGQATNPVESALPAVRTPLVVSDITAEATITPDSMSIRKLEGRHGRSPVAMSGAVLFGKGDVLKQCRMEITAQQVSLDPATIGLLPPAAASQAAAFRPEGDVNLVVELNQADSNTPPEYTVVMDCLGDKINHERFPYPLQDVRGTVTFAKDGIVLKKITAHADCGFRIADADSIAADRRSESESALQNPQSTIQVDGSVTVAGGKLGNGSLTVKATNMLFTESLGRALPEALAGLYREMSPRGPFDLDLTTLQMSKDASGEVLVEFGGKAELRTCNLMASGTPLTLTGTLESQGSYSATRGFSQGRARLAAEQLLVKGKTVTHADLEAIYDPNAHTWTAENFVGDCYGGKLLGSLEVGAARPGSGTTPGNRRPPSAELSDSDRGANGTLEREESCWEDQSAIRQRKSATDRVPTPGGARRRGLAAVPPGGREDRQWPGAGTAVVRPPLVVLRLQRQDGCRTESSRPAWASPPRTRRTSPPRARVPRYAAPTRNGAASATSISRTCRSGRSRPWATCCRCCG